MPKYENTLIYKWVCLNPQITDFYVGATTAWTGCRFRHITDSIDRHEKKYDSLLSRAMRANEGYRNWKMVFIEDFPCSCKREKDARLQYWIDELKPTLNHQCSAKEYEKYEAMWAKQNKRGYRVRKPKFKKEDPEEKDDDDEIPPNFELRF